MATNLIAFSCIGNAICIIRPDGTGLRQLASGQQLFENPAWSPDGGKIAFDNCAGSKSRPGQIFIMNADGTGIVQVTHDSAEDCQPKWSPDSTKIAFVAGLARPNGTGDIYVMNADGSHRARLTATPAYELDPAWSPNGAHIAFARVDHNTASIYIMKANGTHQVRILPGSFTPAFSPDGTRLAFIEAGVGMFVASLSTGKITQITKGSNDNEPSWSPDSTKIAFRRGPTGPSAEIYVVNADGSGLTQLTHDAQVNLEPAWSPS